MRLERLASFLDLAKEGTLLQRPFADLALATYLKVIIIMIIMIITRLAAYLKVSLHLSRRLQPTHGLYASPPRGGPTLEL